MDKYVIYSGFWQRNLQKYTAMFSEAKKNDREREKDVGSKKKRI